MTEQVRYRIEAGLVSEAESVCKRLGISPSAAVSLFFAQMVRAGGLPFRPSEFPVLDEYGVTLTEATAAEEGALAEVQRDRKAGKAVKFTGAL